MCYEQISTAEGAFEQSKDKYNYKRTENSWDTKDPKDKINVESWLNTNFLQLPRAMPDRMRNSAQNLMKHVYKGKLKTEYPILRVATVRVKPKEKKLISGPTRWTAYHPIYRHKYTLDSGTNHVRDMVIAQESSIIAEEFLRDTGVGALFTFHG